LQQGALSKTWLEFGGILPTIFFGWITDRIGGRRALVAAFCMLPIMGAFAGIISTPRGYLWLDYLLLMTIGCFIYPVINLIVIAALDSVSKKAIGTAAGFIGLFGYVGKAVGSKQFAWIVDTYEPSLGKEAAWEIVLYTILCCAGIAAVLLALMWKTRPRA
jgi:OPA family glycerol-3-phosphate transporter-like MFS transporter